MDRIWITLRRIARLFRRKVVCIPVVQLQVEWGGTCPACKFFGLFNIKHETGGATFYRCEECFTYFDASMNIVDEKEVPYVPRQ